MALVWLGAFWLAASALFAWVWGHGVGIGRAGTTRGRLGGD